VADHPLRPATDRRLGRPLPHQLPNRTQAAPKAHHCFVPQDICGISPSFPGLSPTSGHIPTRYSPVRRCHCWPRDLHVLSMPPAFTLSQDQTLRFIHHHQAQHPAAAPNHPALTLSPTISQPSQDHQTPNQSTPKASAPLSEHQHPSADRASHPSHQQPTHEPPAHHGRYHSHPSAQHPAITQDSQEPNTSKTDSSVKEQHQISPRQPQVRPPHHQSSETTARSSGPTNIGTLPTPVNPTTNGVSGLLRGSAGHVKQVSYGGVQCIKRIARHLDLQPDSKIGD
jgi:hypothetical protein